MTTKAKTLLVLACCWMVARGAPSQGDGARLLVRQARASQINQSTLLPAAIVVVPHVREYHFAATATDAGGLTSDFSTEAVLQVTNRIPTVTCAWDPPTGTNAIARYTLFQGPAAGTYTNSVTTTNTQATIEISPPVPTNLVLTVTSVGLTNILWREGLKENWALLGATNLSVTNHAPTKLRLYRGLGKPATAVKRLYVRYRLQ